MRKPPTHRTLPFKRNILSHNWPNLSSVIKGDESYAAFVMKDFRVMFCHFTVLIFGATAATGDHVKTCQLRIFFRKRCEFLKFLHNLFKTQLLYKMNACEYVIIIATVQHTMV